LPWFFNFSLLNCSHLAKLVDYAICHESSVTHCRDACEAQMHQMMHQMTPCGFLQKLYQRGYWM
jgi:hypothetical protein